MNVLVLNAGSSSLKLRLLDGDDNLVATKDLPRLAGAELGHVLSTFCKENPAIDAAGHRVVHGGSAFREPVLLDAGTDAALEALADLAPLHNPPSLAAIEALRSLFPDLPQVACFDTAFHADMPAKAATYAVPKEWRERWDIRRFGFHGLSHAWASRRAGELLGQPREQLRLVTAHLGAGASLAAVRFGRSVDTTMGFTPMEGLVMATRSGASIPGCVFGSSAAAAFRPTTSKTPLNTSRVCEGSPGFGDLRRVIAADGPGDLRASLPTRSTSIGSRPTWPPCAPPWAAIDALVFTGGAGEASPRLRADVCAALGFLGIELESKPNELSAGDGTISLRGGDVGRFGGRGSGGPRGCPSCARTA